MLMDFLKRKFVAFLVIVTVLVALIAGAGAIWAKSSGKSNMITDATSIVISPVQGAFSWVFGNIGNFFGYFGSAGKTREENIVLKTKVMELERQVSELENFKEENDRLRSMLDLKLWNQNYETVGAEIIARDVNNWAGTIKIDKGSLNGISQNDVVIENTGLVGYVSEVGTTWANITTIISPGSNVSCMLPRTGEIVMLEGSVEETKKGICRLSFIPSDSTIAVGEAVETSGEGGIFPKGIFIGRVDKVAGDGSGVSKEAEITPSANFKTLREVLVIKMNRNQ